MKGLYLVLSLFFSFSAACAQDGYIKGKPALAYWQLGDKAEIVIVLHGGPGVPHQYLRPEFDALSKVAKVIYYDQRGCGKSEEVGSAVWQNQVKDLKRVVQTFAKGKKITLAGSSWGTSLALLYAYHYPHDVKGLILSGTYFWPGKAMSQKEYLIKYDKFLKSSVHLEIRKVKMQEERVSSKITEDGKEIVEIVPLEKEVVYYSGRPSNIPLYSLATAPLFESFSRITVPILIFKGDNNDCIGFKGDKKHCGDQADEYAKHLPQAKVFTITGAGHDPWFSYPEDFFERCHAFIRSISNRL